MADLQTLLLKVSQEITTPASGPSVGAKAATNFKEKSHDNEVAAAAAVSIAVRLAGKDGERRPGDGLDYRRFEDWLMPPRSFTVLRDILIELVEEGSALGLTAHDLFNQFGGNENGKTATGSASEGASEGVRSRDLCTGLRSLNIHFTETEVERVMAEAGAGCIDGDKGAEIGLTYEMFSAMVKKHPRGQPRPQQVVPTASPAESGGRRGDLATAAKAALGTQASPAEPGRRPTDLREGNECRADDGYVSPDSLSPKMTLSELVSAGERWTGGPGTAGTAGTAGSSAAAHVEAFGRVAAGVQAVLTTAVSGGSTERDGDGGGSNTRRQGEFNNRGRGGGPNSGRSVQSPAKLSFAPAIVKGEEKQVTHETTPTPTRLSVSDSGPVPRTGAITPPLGPVRSPSEPHHPTRASRERLKAALEDLDLKERLKPTVGGDQHAGVCSMYDSAGELLLPARHGEGPDFAKKSAPLTRQPSAAAAAEVTAFQRRSSSTRRRSATGVDNGASSDALLRRSSAGGGAKNGSGRRATSVGARRAGGGQRSRRDNVAFSSGRNNSGGHSGTRLEQHRLGKSVEEANFLGGGDGARLGDSRETPEVIGRLRSKVAELELSEQVCCRELWRVWATIFLPCACIACAGACAATDVVRPKRTPTLQCAPGEWISQ